MSASAFVERLDAVLARHWPDLRGRIVVETGGRRRLAMARLAEPPVLAHALESYGRRYPGGDHRAIGSLFVQWYFATTWPGLVTALLTHGRVPPPQSSSLRLDACGTPAGLEVRGEGEPASPQAGLERLVRDHAAALVTGVAAAARMSPRVPWSDAVNVLGWTLEQLDGFVAQPWLNDARAFFVRRLADGTHNPLYRRDAAPGSRGGRPPRRTCCLRYRLHGVSYCGDCPLPAARRHWQRPG